MGIPFLGLKTQQKTRDEQSLSREISALIKLSALDIGYIPWTSSAMTAQAIVYILNEIVINRRRRILELGMGISTFYISKLMSEVPGISFVSIDHDAHWISVCQAALAAKQQGQENHKIIHAPIAPQQLLNGELVAYYDIRKISAETAGFRPDLVIIDGPPAWHSEISRARIPAYSLLLPLIDENASLFVDDYQRAGEAELLALFLANSDWRLALADPSANVAIARNSVSALNPF